MSVIVNKIARGRKVPVLLSNAATKDRRPITTRSAAAQRGKTKMPTAKTARTIENFIRLLLLI
jgi:hypothetical protein